MVINFISSISDSDETRTIHTKSDNIAVKTDEVIEELFNFFFAKVSRRIRRFNERK